MSGGMAVAAVLAEAGVDNSARLGFALVLIAGIVAVYLLMPVRDAIDTGVCDPLYRQASTLADSTVIDLQPAPRWRGSGGYQGGVPTCGELRRLKAAKAH